MVSYVMNSGPRPVASPDLSARALKRGSNQLLGISLSDISNPFFAEFELQIELAALASTRAAGLPDGPKTRGALAPELSDGADHRAVLRLFQQPVDGPCAVRS